MHDLLVLLAHPLTTLASFPGPGGARAIVELKRHNPRGGCPRIAQRINKAFGIDIDKGKSGVSSAPAAAEIRSRRFSGVLWRVLRCFPAPQSAPACFLLLLIMGSPVCHSSAANARRPYSGEWGDICVDTENWAMTLSVSRVLVVLAFLQIPPTASSVVGVSHPLVHTESGRYF